MELNSLPILSHEPIAENTFRLVLKRFDNQVIKCGQFAMIKVDGKYLKRPLSINDFDDETITFIYKILGEGTKSLSESKETAIECFYPLGNGFEIDDKPATIIAGGVGIAPMLALAKKLEQNNIPMEFHLGYQTKAQIFLAKELQQYGQVSIYTEDGSYGTKGYCLPKKLNSLHQIYSCGPHGMLNAVAYSYPNCGQLSTEEYMACGFGICAGCAIKLKSGIKKVCQDGPVFDIKEFRCQ